jgi:hypothetical protein
MWAPANASEIEAAVDREQLGETPSFDAKEALPPRKKNIDLAIDICAMTPDGGQLLYGVGEDATKRPTVRKPIELVGSASASTRSRRPASLSLRTSRSLGIRWTTIPAAATSS